MTSDHRKIDTRPWGTFTVIDEDAGYKVKRIVVLPKGRLSYQLHASRSEHWTIVSGQALVTVDGGDFPLTVGESVDVPAGAAHRVANAGSDKLVFIEVQRGAYLGEDDIVRLDDDYGRS